MSGKRLTKNRRSRKKRASKAPLHTKFFRLFRKVLAEPKTLAVAYVSAGFALFIYGGSYQSLQHTKDAFAATLWQATGLELEHIYQEGQHYTKHDAILEAIDVKLGVPLLQIDIDAMRKRIEALPWVQYAVVERLLPSTLSIRMIEHQPVALWQYQEKVQLLNTQGKVIAIEDLEPFSDKIILVGKDAPAHATRFLKMLQDYPETAQLVSSAVRVGQRRWDVHLYNDIKIRLPEENLEEAWRFLDEKHRNEELLSQDIESIDLKVPQKMFIKKRV